jgi:transcriptional regulator with XRE-family HTH domain
MSEEVGPAVRRRQLGGQLRELRKAAGFATMDAAAAATGLSRATISRVESAKQAILPKTVRLLCQLYGIDTPTLNHLLRLSEESEERGWQVEHADTMPHWFQRYAGEEADANRLSTYEAEFVPGLLQTPDYCRAVSEASDPALTEDELGRLVRFRLARQQHLGGGRTPELNVVVNEAVLYRQVGGPEIMRAQLKHLLAAAERPSVTVQVLPFDAGAHPAMVGSFMILQFPPEIGTPTIFVEVDGGGLYPDRPADFERYQWMFDQVRELSLSPDESVTLIRKLAGDA